MALNFTLAARFSGDELESVIQLLEAFGAPSAEWRHQSPGTRMIRAAGRRTSAVLHATRPRRPVTVEDFREAAQRITGEPLELDVGEGLQRWTHGTSRWLFPPSAEKSVFFGFLTAVGPARWLGAKYTLPGFVEVEPGDVVVDCGAFVGGFTTAARGAGATVVAVEPSRSNRRCLEGNVHDSDVVVQPVGLGSPSGRAWFQESSTAVDSTFGLMDEGHAVDRYEVEVLTVDDLCRRTGLTPSFLKVEAEGMELQVLQGLGETRPAKVAVDGSREGGSNDRRLIDAYLRKRGYTVRRDINMIYGRL